MSIPPSLPVLVAALGAAVVLAALAALLQATRRHVVAMHDLDDCAANARHAARAGDSARAAAWSARARRLAPRDAELAMEEAWHRARLGETARAMRCYGEAARLLPPHDGRAELEAGLLAAREGAASLARGLLARAVERDPSLRGEVEDDPVAARLLRGEDARRGGR